MAKRVRKTYKQRQRELETPEVVEETLWSLSDWMEANWKPLVMGLGALTLLWGGIGLFQMFSQSSERSKAETTAAVFTAAGRPVYVKPADLDGEDPNKPLGPSFASEAARADAVIAAAGAAGDDHTALVGVVTGAAKGTKGDIAGQLAAIDAALKDAGDSALAVPLNEQKASALTELGKTAEAAGAWQKVAAGASTVFGKAHALIRIGDLYNANTGATKADPAKAKASYGKALAALKVNKKAPEKGPLAFLHAEAESKLKSL